jgi:hypothetical protein
MARIMSEESVMIECEPFRFKLQSAVQISGPSNVGKSVFVSRVLEHKDELITPAPQLIIYCYSTWQEQLFGEMKKTCGNMIHFVEGMQALEKVTFNPDIRHVLVLDDLMNEVGNSDFGVDLFTKIAHHGNILIFFITQNIYLKAKHMTTINKNIKYNVVFRNKRFRSELETLARQSLGMKPKHIHRIMDWAAEEASHPYIVLDLQNDTPETRAIVTNIFPDDKYPQAYYYVEE